MSSAWKHALVSAAIVAATALPTRAAAAHPQGSYRLEPLDLPPGSTLTGYAPSMNDRGDVMVNVTPGPIHDNEIWVRRSGAWYELTTAPALTNASGYALSAGGEVVGEHGLDPYIWDAQGTPQRLRRVQGLFGTAATDANGRGLVVGYGYEGGTPVTVACTWRMGALHDLPSGPGDYGWEYHGVNATGWTCGLAYPVGQLDARPLLVDPAGNEVAITAQPPFLGGRLWDLNDDAVAVGSAYGSATPEQALFVVGGVARVLPQLGGLLATELTAVNLHGQAAGVGRDAAREYGVVSDGTQVRLVETLLAATATGQWAVDSTHGIDRRGTVLARVRPLSSPPGSPTTLARLVPVF